MLHLIYNPNTKKSEKVLAEARELLDARGAEYDVLSGADPALMRREVARLTEEETTLVAVGGDGTLNAVLSAVACPEKTILGLIPAGTGNDFAAKAGIPYGAGAVDLLLDSEPKYTDFLDCGEGRRSLNIAGLGIDVDILERRERKKAAGKKMSYFSSLLRSLVKYKAVRMRIVADGREESYSVFLAAACNGSQFGSGIPICPPAVIDDGLIDLIAVDCPKKLVLPFYLIKLMRGRLHKNKIYHHVLCREAEIYPEGTDYVQLDGELFPATQLHVRIVSNTLRMYRG